MEPAPKPSSHASGNRSTLSLLLYLFLAVVALLTIYGQQPPAAVSAGASPTEFASGRAMQHLAEITREKHPSGSPAHAAVRDYIVNTLRSMGLDPQVHQTTTSRAFRARTVAAQVQNVWARLPGTGSGKAILMAAHYDSVPNSYGAGDDGSGISVLLETLRALRAGPTLKNDVIFLFTDAEEVGLLGAKAYAEEMAAAQNIGLVLNFDARGTSGPVFMYETSEHNGWLIDEFGKAAPRPFASSLMYAIYKLLPNDTDFTVFRRGGFPGLNFAFIGEVTNYHSLHDSLPQLDEPTVQHEGSYALALARHFGNLNLEQNAPGDAVYFDVLGLKLLTYPVAWGLALLGVLALLFVAAALLGRRQLTLKRLAAGVLLALLNLVVPILLVVLVSVLLNKVRPESTPFSNAGLRLAGYAALAVFLATTMLLLFARRIGFSALSAGALLLWLLLSAATAILLPGASYLFMWPLLFGLGAHVLLSLSDKIAAPLRLILLLIFAVPGVVLVTGVVYNLFLGLGAGLLPLTLGLVVLLAVLLIPQMEFIGARWRWALPFAALAVGVISLVSATFVSTHRSEQPTTDTLFYSLDADTGQAVWASPDPMPDEWTSQFFTGAAKREGAANHFPNSNATYMVAAAPVLSLPAEEVKILSDETSANSRKLRLGIVSPRRARVISVFIEPETEILSASVNGKPLDASAASPVREAGSLWELSCIAVPEAGIELGLEINPSRPLKRIRIVSQTDGLPPTAAAYQPRPDYLVPSAFGDTTRVTRTFNLPPAP